MSLSKICFHTLEKLVLTDLLSFGAVFFLSVLPNFTPPGSGSNTDPDQKYCL
jgi:hypothetical protein